MGKMGVAIKADALRERIKQDGRPVVRIAEQAGVDHSTISRMLSSGRSSVPTVEAVRKALRPAMRARSIYAEYIPNFERAAAEDMVFINDPDKLISDMVLAGYTPDSMSRKLRKSRRYVYTSIAERSIPREVLEKICQIIEHEPSEYSGAGVGVRVSYCPAKPLESFKVDKTKVRQNIARINRQDEIDKLKAERDRLKKENGLLKAEREGFMRLVVSSADKISKLNDTISKQNDTIKELRDKAGRSFWARLWA